MGKLLKRTNIPTGLSVLDEYAAILSRLNECLGAYANDLIAEIAEVNSRITKEGGTPIEWHIALQKTYNIRCMKVKVDKLGRFYLLFQGYYVYVDRSGISVFPATRTPIKSVAPITRRSRSP